MQDFVTTKYNLFLLDLKSGKLVMETKLPIVVEQQGPINTTTSTTPAVGPLTPVGSSQGLAY